jgi:hypothetical protein
MESYVYGKNFFRVFFKNKDGRCPFVRSFASIINMTTNNGILEDRCQILVRNTKENKRDYE